MIRLARIATDERWADALHRDLLRDQRTLDSIGWLDLRAYIDHSPEGTALREAFDGATTSMAVLIAQLRHDIAVLTWNFRSANGIQGEPYPQIEIPGLDRAEEAQPEWTDEGIEEQLNNPALQSIMAA